MLIWAINFVIKSITIRFNMLNTMMENENTNFAYISISFLNKYGQQVQHFAAKQLKRTFEKKSVKLKTVFLKINFEIVSYHKKCKDSNNFHFEIKYCILN